LAAGGVRLAIAGEALGQPALHLGVGGSGVRIDPQPVSERQVPAPVLGAVRDDMKTGDPVGWQGQA
jgi:hypothetical protein